MYRVCVVHIDDLSKLSNQPLALANYAKSAPCWVSNARRKNIK